MYYEIGGEDISLSDDDMKRAVYAFLNEFQEQAGKSMDKVLILPPDYTRFHSQAGKITQFIADFYRCDDPSSKEGNCTTLSILPALGTHAPMTTQQIRTMFGERLLNDPHTDFIVHNWRKDVVTIGEVPSSMVRDATNGMVDMPWPAQLNRLVWEGGHDLVLSIGQVVPHEVMGMANFNKNLFVGCGGVEAINLSHFIGAVHGMENMMGKASNPLRDILNYASENFLQAKLPLWYILTVVGTSKEGDLEVKGFYIGNDIQAYMKACELSLKVNFTMLEKPLKKVVCLLDPEEFHSTWLGNKAIYRTRMAMATGGELIILAPGVKRFGEDDEVDVIIRKYGGYRGTPYIMDKMKEHQDLRDNLSAVAHLIHGSSEGRFRIVYCPGHLTRAEIESVGFDYADLEEMKTIYNPDKLRNGWNTLENGDEIYFIDNPALGLWAARERFSDTVSSHSTEISASSTLMSQLGDQKPTDHSGGVGGWMKEPKC